MATADNTLLADQVGAVGRMLVDIATSTDRQYQTFLQLDRLRKLAPGWDGYEGVAPSEDAIASAKTFVATLPTGTAPPDIEPAGDGEINLVWRSGAAYLEVGFSGGEAYSFLAKAFADPAKTRFGDVLTVANRVPMALQHQLGFFKLDGDVRLREATAEPMALAWTS